jgi:hypothetical protein
MKTYEKLDCGPRHEEWGARLASSGHLTPGEGTTRWALGKKAGWTANADGDSKGNISCFGYEF